MHIFNRPYTPPSHIPHCGKYGDLYILPMTEEDMRYMRNLLLKQRKGMVRDRILHTLRDGLKKIELLARL